MAGPYIAYDSEGNELNGDSTLSPEMLAHAAELGATIKDVSTGQQVYPTQEEQN